MGQRRGKPRQSGLEFLPVGKGLLAGFVAASPNFFSQAAFRPLLGSLDGLELSL